MLIPPARLRALRRRLLAWWDAGHRQLPWRFPQRAADPYRVWLAEVMLQQTRVEAVLPYYRRFVDRWPTLAALAAAEDAEVFAAWSGLGYYARCRNLLAAAREALRRHGGLPSSLEALQALPGFGPYTAGAVASIAFAIPAAAVDGNAARVLARLFAVRGDPLGRVHRRRVDALARALVEERRPGDWNQAVMELGATVCGRSPGCTRCPLRALCRARAAGAARELPRPRTRRARTAAELACAIVERRGRVLLFRRPPRGLFAGLLAFPAVSVGAGEDAPAALARGLRRQGLRVHVGPERACVDRTLTHRDLRIRAFSCDLLAAGVPGPPRRPSGQAGKAEPPGERRWVRVDRLAAAGMPAAMNALVPLAFSARVV